MCAFQNSRKHGVGHIVYYIRVPRKDLDGGSSGG